MNVFSNIWRDARLLNATVYAQWLCILSAVSFVVIRICWLITADTPAHDFGESAGIAIMVADMILFPAMSLVVELSHIIRLRWVGLFGVFYCLLRVFTGFVISTSQESGSMPSGPFIFMGIARVTASYYGLMLPYIPNKTALDPEPRAMTNIESLPVRACFHFAYSLALPYTSRPHYFAVRLFEHSRPKLWHVRFLAPYGIAAYYEPAVLFSTLASLAYWMALLFRQEYVFSRTLGGPGVERLTFIRPGRVQTIDSIGLEEGAIRLP